MKKPFWHASQEEEDGTGAKNPSGQTLHAEVSVVCPDFGENFPAAHAEHSSSCVKAVRPEYLPAEQL